MGKRLIFILICIFMLSCDLMINKSSKQKGSKKPSTKIENQDTQNPFKPDGSASNISDDISNPTIPDATSSTQTQQGNTSDNQDSTQDQDKKDSVPAPQRPDINLKPKKPEPPIKESPTITIKESHRTTEYYYKDYEPDLISPACKINMNLFMVTNNRDYPIINNKRVTHVRLLAQKNIVQRAGIRHISDLAKKDFLEILMDPNRPHIHALKLMLLSEDQDYIIVPFNVIFAEDIINTSRNSKDIVMTLPEHMIGMKLGNDDIYTFRPFTRFSLIDNEQLISMETKELSHSPSHKITLGVDIAGLLKLMCHIPYLKDYVQIEYPVK
ncbi:hypothetical protein [Candidatus Borreliella tachyglossi]|uniref:hypothetical protein n=1 Tax=Candidatus Borreliella tachyglossi TaxID=1964448 RepID=UPI0040430367